MDDHIHRLMLEDNQNVPWRGTHPLNLFNIVPDDPAFASESIQIGTSPWWGSPKFHASFMRPLSSALKYLDFRVFGDNFAAMHVHSLLWLAAMLFCSAVLFRRVEGSGPIFALATILFSLDGSHVFPAGWLANRNSLIATTFALLTLIGHHKWRGERRLAGAVLGPLCFALGLCAGEFALGATAFLFSFAVFMDRATPGSRALSLFPYVLVTVIWRVIYNFLGYGAMGSDLYIDPLGEPGAFALAAVTRMPVLLSAVLGPPGSEISVMLPPSLTFAHVAGSSCWVVLMAIVLWPVLRNDRTARFWGLGTVLAIVPSCATFSHDRLAMLAALGGAGLLARVLSHWLDSPFKPDNRAWRLLAGFMVASTVLFKVIVPAVTNPILSTAVAQMRKISDRATESIAATPNFEKQTLVIMTAPDFFTSAFMPVWRESLGLQNPKQIEVLTNGIKPVTFTRVDPYSLTIEMKGGHFGVWTHALVRKSSEILAPGWVNERPGVTYEVLTSAPNNQPEKIKVTFDEPLDSAKYRFMRWHDHGYIDVVLPKPGESVTFEIDITKIIEL